MRGADKGHNMKRWKAVMPIIALGAAMLPHVVVAQAQTPAPELKVGDRAPEFSLPGTDGKTYSLSGLKGKTVVLAWFPKAFTGG
jgi:thioredoxin-dependent peroxiredoxin